jgi:hypothetical protein
VRPGKSAWRSMVSRCHDSAARDWRYYGARGISVCPRWRESFDAFLADVGPRPKGMHLDRIDPHKGYEPGNVRWVTPLENNHNRRNLARITAFGETRILAEWARKTGLARHVIDGRLRYGWSPETALSTPVADKRAPVTHDGKTQSIAAWAQDLGVNKHTLWNRIQKFGWSLERALSPGDKRFKKGSM